MVRLLTCCVLGVFLALPAKANSNASDTLQPLLFGCTSPSDQADTVFIADIIRPVLAEKGYRLEFEQVTDDSAFERLQQGELAGDCGRIADLNRLRGLNLLKVTPAFRRANFALWGIPPLNLQEKSLSELRIGYFRSVIYAPTLAAEAGFDRLHGFDSLVAADAALQRGELDAILSYEAQVRGYNNRTGRRLKLLQHIVTFPVHVYLSPKYTSLAPAFGEAIQRRVQKKPYNPYPQAELPLLRRNKIVFGCPLPADTPVFNALEKIYSDAFSALGYEFELFALPRAREEVELLKGNLDGSCGRGDNPPYNNHKALVRVQTPIVNTSFEVISAQPHRLVWSIAELEAGSRVAYVRGTSLIKEKLSLAGHLTAVDVTSAELGVKMLAAGRVDFFVDIPANINYLLEVFDINKTLFTVSELPKATYYPYMQKRHAALVGPLEQHFDVFMEKTKQRTLLGNE